MVTSDEVNWVLLRIEQFKEPADPDCVVGPDMLESNTVEPIEVMVKVNIISCFYDPIQGLVVVPRM